MISPKRMVNTLWNTVRTTTWETKWTNGHFAIDKNVMIKCRKRLRRCDDKTAVFQYDFCNKNKRKYMAVGMEWRGDKIIYITDYVFADKDMMYLVLQNCFFHKAEESDGWHISLIAFDTAGNIIDWH